MSNDSQDVPHVSDVLAGSPSNWGKWGNDDEVGALNYLGVTEVLAGVATIRQGKTFTLQAEIGHPHGDMLAPVRQPASKTMAVDQGTFAGDDAPNLPGGARYADDVITMFLQGSTQYDALGHVWYDDQLYNGYDASTTIGGLSKVSILPIAERGIVGRGVLIDLPRLRGNSRLDPGELITHEDIMAAAAAQGVELRKRDILVIYTGWMEYFYSQEPADFYQQPEPGLVYSPELVSWFQEMEIPNLVIDTMSPEQGIDPETGAALLVHSSLMRNLGIAFAEVCRLGELAIDCEQDGQWDFLYVAAPLKVRNGTGAPVNPVVIK